MQANRVELNVNTASLQTRIFTGKRNISEAYKILIAIVLKNSNARPLNAASIYNKCRRIVMRHSQLFNNIRPILFSTVENILESSSIVCRVSCLSNEPSYSLSEENISANLRTSVHELESAMQLHRSVSTSFTIEAILRKSPSDAALRKPSQQYQPNYLSILPETQYSPLCELQKLVNSL